MKHGYLQDYPPWDLIGTTKAIQEETRVSNQDPQPIGPAIASAHIRNPDPANERLGQKFLGGWDLREPRIRDFAAASSTHRLGGSFGVSAMSEGFLAARFGSLGTGLVYRGGINAVFDFFMQDEFCSCALVADCQAAVLALATRRQPVPSCSGTWKKSDTLVRDI